MLVLAEKVLVNFVELSGIDRTVGDDIDLNVSLRMNPKSTPGMVTICHQFLKSF